MNSCQERASGNTSAICQEASEASADAAWLLCSLKENLAAFLGEVSPAAYPLLPPMSSISTSLMSCKKAFFCQPGTCQARAWKNRHCLCNGES